MLVKFSDLVEDSDERLGKDQSYMLDSIKLRKEQKWKNNINLEEGLLSTIKWIDESLETLKNLPHKYIHKT
jgi:dTDP-glucose 4,6-dehydratase